MSESLTSIANASIAMIGLGSDKNDPSLAQSFGFWVAAVNFGSNRGPERVRSFANTIIEVKNISD